MLRVSVTSLGRATPSQLAALEQKLLSYFSPARTQLIATSPIALQAETYYDASAVVSSVLFPDQQISATETKVPERDAFPAGADMGTDDSPKGGGSTNVLSASQAVLEVDKHRSTREVFRDLHVFRSMSGRCTTAVDAESKRATVQEVDAALVQQDISNIWEGQVVQALHSLVNDVREKQALSASEKRSVSTSNKGAATPRLPDEVIFVVAFSESMGVNAVGGSLKRIARRIEALVEAPAPPHHRPVFPFDRVLRVVPIFIGIDARDHSIPSVQGDALFYQKGGIYTASSVLQCLRALPPITVPSVGREEIGIGVVHEVVKRKVVLLSDAFMHPRLLADMHGRQRILPSTHSSSCQTRGDASDNGQGHVNEGYSLSVLPAVVSDALSEMEEEAFARYAICQLFREQHEEA